MALTRAGRCVVCVWSSIRQAYAASDGFSQGSAVTWFRWGAWASL